MTLQIEKLSPADDQEVTAFLDRLSTQTPWVLGYHYPFYREMLSGLGLGEPLYLGAWRRDELVGLLPVFCKKTSAGTVLNSLPFFGPNAGVLCGPEAPGPIHRHLLEAFKELAEAEDAISAAVYTPFLFQDFHWYDEALPGALVVEKFTQHLQLLPATPWSSKIRYDIQKAKKEGVTIRQEATPENIQRFYEIYRQNCEDYNIPRKPRACLDLLTGPGVLGRNAEIFFAFREDEMIGGLLLLFSPATASYYIPCASAAARTLQPGTVLIDEAARAARRRGISCWNWESSPARDSGVYRFKKKWGSVESSYKVYVTIRRPETYFRTLGVEKIREYFPFYFVYPFGLLEPATGGPS